VFSDMAEKQGKCGSFLEAIILKKRYDQRYGERGMVTIEATLSLTTFLFAFMTIFSIITVCRAQARIQVALNNTAQEISQYSYIYGLSGLDASFAEMQGEANKTKADINGLVGTTVEVFDGIQSIGDEIPTNTENISIETVMDEWENISEKMDETGADLTALKEQIEQMTEDPQKLLFGMAKLIGSEALELTKSRLIAEPISRALIKKHLKRSERDTAEAFCKSVGIVPGTYFGQTSYFNGIDFSRSTLFPYGSEEITLVATYKVKLLQLLPIDMEYTITQSAVTMGWLHGDKTTNSAAQMVEELKEANVDASVWNSQTISKRNKSIRTLELDKLKDLGYVGVSGETYVQAYDEASNTVAFIACSNPVYGVKKIEDIDKRAVQDDIKRLVAQMDSTTDNRIFITVKVRDEKGNMTTKKIQCGDRPINKRIILVVPEDAGVDSYVQSVIDELGYSDMFEVTPGYGTGFERPKKADSTPAETGEGEAG